MKIVRGFIALVSLCVARVGWASCAADLSALHIAELPGRHPVPGCSEPEPSIGPGRPGQCGWSATVLKDMPLGSDQRLVLFDESHATGSGTRQYLAVYACVDDKPSVVFEQRYTDGARVEQVDGKGIVVVSGHWAKGDAMCCPSQETRQVFIWKSSVHRYVLKQAAYIGGKSDKLST